MSDLLAPKGHHTCTVEEVYQFGERWPVGKTQRLAIGLLLWTGARRSDLVILGRQHERIFTNERGEPEQWLYWKIEKGKKRKPKRAEIPLLPELRELLDASPVGDTTYLISQRGRPFSPASFGTRFRAWCDTAGLQHCSAHGVRKAGACIAVENGATESQLQAICRWDSMSMAQLYTR